MPRRWLMPSENFPARRLATEVKPHLVQDLVDPAERDVVGEGQPAQVVAGGASRVERLGVEQAADLAQRPGQLGIGLAADQGRPRVGVCRGP